MAKVSHLSHFEMPTNTDVNYKAKCKHCGWNISGSAKTIFNFTMQGTIGVLPGIVVHTILLIMLIQPWQTYMEILHLLAIY